MRGLVGQGLAVIVCKRVYYLGRVQGVGFRYTAQRIAERFGVTGYVKNLPGGEVELVAEGEAEAVHCFLDAVAQRMAGYIHETRVTDVPACGSQDFRLRH